MSRCSKFEATPRGGWCAYTDPVHDSGDVAYYFTGRGSNEHTWWDSEGRGLRNAWNDSGAATPTVVTINFGTGTGIGFWLLTPRLKDGSEGLFQLFVDQVLAEVEKKLGGIRGRRLLIGSSMGGFNASQLLLHRPGLWSRVALLCPAILAVSPYSTVPEGVDYMKRSGAGPFSTWLLQWFFRDWFQAQPDWEEVSPLGTAETLLGPDTPPLFVSAGLQDHYGFWLGGQLFAETAALVSTNEVTWKPVKGNHCSFDPVSLADFLVR